MSKLGNKVALTTGSTKIFEISSIGANVTSGQLFTQNGTASAPGICVGQAGNVGLYLVSSGIGFVTAGTQYGSLSSAGAWTLGSGTATEHALNTLLAANAAGVCTLTNGPSGKSGNPTGWISINVNGSSARVIPYW